jgi:hypothetical protein
MATARWCREAVQLTRVVRYLSCFDVHRTLARRLSHRTRPTGVRAPCPGHTKHTFLAELGAARLKAFEASAGPG